MEVKCPHCNVVFKTPIEYKGKKIKCPKCKQIFMLDTKNENRNLLPKTKWKIVAIFAFLVVFTLIVIVGHYWKVKNSERKASHQPYSKNGLDDSKSDNEVFKDSTDTQSNKNPEEYIFKPVKSLTPTERQFVLDSARKKLISVLKNKDSSFDPWMILYTKPMTTTELEVLGDYILKQKVANHGGVVPFALKIEDYWNRRVAETSMAAEMHHSSFFYNSSHEIGNRVLFGDKCEPKSLDDRGLYDYFLRDGLCFYFVKPLEYDTKNQVLYLELPVKSMIELIFHTFEALSQSTWVCVFDRMPNLQKVTIVYKDSQGKEIGYGSYDLQYWQELVLSAPFPFEKESDYTDKLLRLNTEYKSKLITKEEYVARSKSLRNAYNEQKLQYYREKWLKLFPLIKDFSLDKELPLTTEDFFFRMIGNREQPVVNNGADNASRFLP